MKRWSLLALDLVLLGLAAWQLGIVGAAIAARVPFGFDIEWMEGATLVSAMRVRDGLPIYGDPSFDYIPFIYPPLYAWVVGTLAHVWPLGYTLARSVSTVGSVLGALAIVVAGRRAGARWSVAVAGAALFASTYVESGTFFDLVRTDGLSIGLLGAALVTGAGPKRGHAVAGGLLLALAFTCKHHAALFGVPMLAALWWRYGRRHALGFAVAALGPALAFTVGMEVATGGRFLRWLLEVPAYHGINGERFWPWISVQSWSPLSVKTGGAPIEVWKALPVSTTGVLVGTAWWWWRERGAAATDAGPAGASADAPRGDVFGVYWAGVGLMALFVVALMRGHTGGFVNVLIPMFWAEAALAVVVAGAFTRGWSAHLVALVLAAQLWQGRDELRKYIPTEADTAAGEAVIEVLRELPGPIFIPHAPWYAVMAGKETSFALICLWDIDHRGGPYRGDAPRFYRSLRRQHWGSAVIPDLKATDNIQKELKAGWTRTRSLPSPSLSTRTGWGVRLRSVWLPTPGAGEAEAPSP